MDSRGKAEELGERGEMVVTYSQWKRDPGQC